jgi:hypothetical protein
MKIKYYCTKCKNFIWQKFEKKRVINNENYLEWKKVE